MKGRMICFASDGFNVNTDITLTQEVTISPRTNASFADFETAFNNGLAVDEWLVNTGPYVGTTIHGGAANALYGRFANGIDNSQGVHANWAFYGKGLDVNTGYLEDCIGVKTTCYTNDYYILNSLFGAPVGPSKPYNEITLGDFGYNGSCGNVYYIIESSVDILSTGEVHIYIDQSQLLIH